MKYTIDPSVFSSSFSFPSSVVDENLKLATATELKVILYFFRHIAEGIDPGKCAERLGLPVKDVAAALSFWVGAGLINAENQETAVSFTADKAVEKNAKPTRLDVAKRGTEDNNFAMILRDAQSKLGRSLKTNEASTFLYIYEDLGLDPSVCLYLLQYAVSENKPNIRFIEKTAVKWVNAEVRTIADAERIVKKEITENLAWRRCEKAFGIEHRKPSQKETECALRWFDEWSLPDDYVALAYNVCVDTKSKFIFSYCAKIIENWHKLGFKTKTEVERYLDGASGGSESGADSYAGYDLELYERMIDDEDREES